MQLPLADKILSIKQINGSIKDLLEDSFPSVWVRGEISNLRKPSSGHFYFTLKDQSSQISCVLFRSDANKISSAPRDGMQIIAYGSIGVYSPSGSYQIVVRQFIPDGAGQLQIQFEKLKNKLQTEKIFDTDHKRPIPVNPKKVAVLTSENGAALQDFIRILKRRNWSGLLGIFPVSVQGERAPLEIMEAITSVENSNSVDLIIITRGGGSIEDLWAFNNEHLIRKIYSCEIPIISAVGHEIDFTLTDFVADKRAETPSGAAEIISSQNIKNKETIHQIKSRIELAKNRYLEYYKSNFKQMDSALKLRSPLGKIENAFLKLDSLESKMISANWTPFNIKRNKIESLSDQLNQFDPQHLIENHRQKLNQLNDKFESTSLLSFQSKKHRLELVKRELQSNDHKKILNKGYSMTTNLNGEIVYNSNHLNPKDLLLTHLKQGSIQSSVMKIISDDHSD